MSGKHRFVYRITVTTTTTAAVAAATTIATAIWTNAFGAAQFSYVRSWRDLLSHSCCYAAAAFSKSIIAATIIMIITIIVLRSFFSMCKVYLFWLKVVCVRVSERMCANVCTKQIHCLTYCLFTSFLLVLSFSIHKKWKRENTHTRTHKRKRCR